MRHLTSALVASISRYRRNAIGWCGNCAAMFTEFIQNSLNMAKAYRRQANVLKAKKNRAKNSADQEWPVANLRVAISASTRIEQAFGHGAIRAGREHPPSERAQVPTFLGWHQQRYSPATVRTLVDFLRRSATRRCLEQSSSKRTSGTISTMASGFRGDRPAPIRSSVQRLPAAPPSRCGGASGWHIRAAS